MDRLDSVTASVQGINNSVDDAGKASLKGIAEKIAQESLHGRDYTVFVQYLREFVNTVAFNIRLPVVSIKTLTRTYIDMWNNPDLARHIMQNVYDIDIEEDSDNLDNAPDELRQHLSKEAIDIYRKALRQGKGKYRNIRLMVVGMFQVGKTSLVNNLIEDFESKRKEETKSTEGIDVHKCQIINRKWRISVPTLRDRLRAVEIPPEKRSEVFERPMATENEEEKEQEIDQTQNENKENLKEEVVIYERKEKTELDVNVSKEEVPERVKELMAVFTPNVQDNAEKHDHVTELTHDKEVSPSVSVWDFAGQNLYYTTHHFFLNSRSIYLLLMDVSKPLKEKADCPPAGIVLEPHTSKDAFKFWLNSIHMYSILESENQNFTPTVILVGTHKDELEKKGKDPEKCNENFFNDALCEFIDRDSGVLRRIHDKKFLVNNNNHESSDYETLRDTIEKLASEQHYWDKELPARWIELEQYLDLLREDGNALITYDDVRRVNSKMTSPIDGDKQITVFLKTQHLLGNLLYFDTDELKDLVLLNPLWAIEAFKTFIKHTREKKPRDLKQWRKFEKCAILTDKLIDEFMNEADKSVKPHKKEVLGFLEKLDVIAKPVNMEDYETEQNINPIHEAREFYIVPCLLQDALKGREMIQQLIHKPEDEIIRRTPVLCYEFKDGYMPPGIFHRLQASCIRSWEIDKNADEFLLYNGCGVFNVTRNRTSKLMIWYYDHRIYARIFVTSCYTINEFTDVVERTRDILESSLKAILWMISKESANSSYETYIQCDRCRWEPGKHLYRKKDFEPRTVINCEGHLISYSCVFGLWFRKYLLDEVENTLSSKASEAQLAKLARIIEPRSKCWNLGLELGIPQETMDCLKRENEEHSLIYSMLRCWGNYNENIRTLWNTMLELRMNIECFDQVFLKDNGI